MLEFIEKAKLVHGDKYDYSEVEYKSSREKVKIICPIHGEFNQEPASHLRGRGCPKCGRIHKKNDLTELIEKANSIHKNKYDYSKVNYKNHTQKITIICPTHGEFKQSFTEHINQKHGCPKCSKRHNYSTEEFVEMAKVVHGNKYDYSEVEYKNNYSKIRIICPIHGSFEQEPCVHLLGHGCSKCYGNYSYTSEEWIEKAKAVHGNRYDYSITEYKNLATKVKILCSIHGEFEQLPENHLNGYGCFKCSRTIGEDRIAEILREANIEFEEQKSFDDLIFKKKLRFDFYLPKLNTVIEYNGRQHYEWVKLFDKTYKDFLESRHRDWLKRRYCKKKGIKLVVIPYWDFEVIKEKLKVNSIGENK